MVTFKESLQVLESLFAKDEQFALATTDGETPSVRMIDTFYESGAFYCVTYAKSQKVREINKNERVALCKNLYRFSGIAHNIGHPLKEENKAIREKLIKAFEPWYFKHNNEADEAMCYVKIELTQGFFYKDGIGYGVDFKAQTVESFPFEFDIVLAD